MLDILQRVWENLVARTEGPLNLRIFIQPTVSIVFAVLAALRDAKAQTTPFLRRVQLADRAGRHIAMKELWKDVGKVFILGTTFDIVYQLLVIFRLRTETAFYPLESLLVAFMLAMLPYLLLRGPVNRLVSWFRNRRR